MSQLRFEWDKENNLINQKKHGVSFEEEKSVFYDDNAIQFWDEQHSDFEDRFLLLGISSKMRILLIVHCDREQESVIRIISARKATKNESKLYEG
ncbi:MULTISPECIES: BrnT family toxin [unclassified Okeania]|uniref:BrnT family toxin n=1 Tax=unclassified Okeania TaxID=2634635 RepID=UPI0013BCC00F|nr:MULTISPECIES: BrnT family toxin [unclassified Okeania]NES78125.1 BrnT family toxin [Okeania sp. SIO1H4]NET12221.1 BrnT family toxin [Okeania sp. SIO1H6]NET18865.1 BrnT family toxin [Okeania sp. SIO1H5]NET94859.1 BrnT family toxin [Okeania sp. SIO1H2]